MFARLKELRDKLASIPAFAVDAETMVELVNAINELDDAMVMWVRAENHVRDLPRPEYNEQYAEAGVC